MTNQITRCIDKGKPLAIVQSLIETEYKKLHKAEFYKAQREAYDALGYWTSVVDTPELLDTDGVTVLEEAVYTFVLTDGMPTYEEYKNESVITTIGVEATYDEDGVELTPAVQEVTELVRPYVEPLQADIDALVAADDTLVAYKLKLAQEAMNTSIDKLTVTTATGKVFDANLKARQNMADGILASETLNITETTWRLADNSEVLVDILELREAHALALLAYAQAKSIGA